MSIYAIPFIQKIVSVHDHCIQEPLESTYMDHYRTVADTIAKRELRQHALNEERMRNNKCGSLQTCNKRITTYMNDYRNPYRNPEYNLLAKQQDANKDCNTKELIPTEPKTEIKLDDSNSNIGKCNFPTQNIEEKIPEWKRIGWRNKERCWRRPLRERREYKLQDPLRFYDRKCCGRCVCR